MHLGWDLGCKLHQATSLWSTPLRSSKHTGVAERVGPKYTPEANVGSKNSLGHWQAWMDPTPLSTVLSATQPSKDEAHTSLPAPPQKCAPAVHTSVVCVYVLTAACHQDVRQGLHTFSMTVWDELTCFLQVFDPGKAGWGNANTFDS